MYVIRASGLSVLLGLCMIVCTTIPYPLIIYLCTPECLCVGIRLKIGAVRFAGAMEDRVFAHTSRCDSTRPQSCISYMAVGLGNPPPIQTPTHATESVPFFCILNTGLWCLVYEGQSVLSDYVNTFYVADCFELCFSTRYGP